MTGAQLHNIHNIYTKFESNLPIGFQDNIGTMNLLSKRKKNIRNFHECKDISMKISGAQLHYICKIYIKFE